MAIPAMADGFNLRPFPGRPGPGYRTDVVYVQCKSTDYRYNSCNAGGRVLRVSVQRQDSHSACAEGLSYGARGDQIWVDRGCEANFRVEIQRGGFGPGPAPGPGPGPIVPDTRIVTCQSNDNRLTRCDIGDLVLGVRVRRQLSRASCSEGYSYGADRDSIWVDRGCRAEFEVRVARRH
jgi:hypothetical protein